MKNISDNLKTTVLLLILALALIVLASCKTAMEKQIEKETGADVNIDTKGDNTQMTIKSDDGDTQVEINSKNTDDWCPVGSTYSQSGDTGNVNMEVIGIETSGKYAGLCHMKYDINTEDTGTVDYYFDESGSGYQVIDVNGEKMEMQWTKD